MQLDVKQLDVKQQEISLPPPPIPSQFGLPQDKIQYVNTSRPLPEGWSSTIDGLTSRPYYVCHSRKRVTWTHPSVLDFQHPPGSQVCFSDNGLIYLTYGDHDGDAIWFVPSSERDKYDVSWKTPVKVKYHAKTSPRV